MNRKLHNTATALFATTGLLVLTLIAAQPVPADAAFAPAQVAEVQASADRARASAARIEAQARVLEQQLLASRSNTEALGAIVGFATEAAALAVAAEALERENAEDATVEPAPRKATPRRSRQSVAMPFFSFAPRG